MTIKQTALHLSRDLRKKQTEAEQIFWKAVRRKQFMGYKFLRQHPLFYKYYGKEKFFIADFYCRELGLVVEIDGGVHREQENYDQIRSEILETQKDLKIVRFKNEEVFGNINRVIMELRRSL
jgi:very-short-patch-repair endonuclease